MKLMIFGAKGGTGLQLVRQSLSAGHTVTIVAKNPKALSIQHPKLRVVKGNLLDQKSLENALQNQDAVISALGPNKYLTKTKYSKLHTIGIDNLLKAMEKKDVKRFIAISLSSLQKGNFFASLKHLFQTPKQDFEKRIKSSGLDWTLIRPTGLTYGPQLGNYQLSVDNSIPSRGKISRADLAEFIISQLSSDQFFKKTVSLAY